MPDNYLEIVLKLKICVQKIPGRIIGFSYGKMPRVLIYIIGWCWGGRRKRHKVRGTMLESEIFWSNCGT
jgi:hypothetical protein